MKKRLLSIVLISVFLLSFCAVYYSPLKITDNNDAFREKLVDIYQKYDSLSEKSDSPFALKRLMLSNYRSDKTYGAADWAIDEKHSFAVLQYESEAAAKQALEQIKKDGIAAEPDSKSVLDSFDKGSVNPTASNALGTPSYISKFNMEKEEVVVAVIDTGVMYDHELMENRFVSRGYDFSDDGRSNAYYDTSMSDSTYIHATFVCGIIADNTPDNVKLLPYKAVPFGANEASNSAIVGAIYDAVDKGADVINISMSAVSGANAFKYAVQNALENNVCICASAGNDSKEIKYRYPAAINGVITVSSVENDMQTFSSFSNFGTAVDFCAPGRKVVSACPYKSGGEKYMTASGTSFSAPYVSAVCANIKSINCSYSKDEVYSIICDFSVDLGNEGYDIYFGNGLPKLSDMVYTDSETYTCSIPEGTLEIYNNTCNYTAQTQPWRLFADRIMSVAVDGGVDEIGSYSFCNMSKAVFTMPEKYKSIGDYAFYSCKNIKTIEFDEEIGIIGEKAFGDLAPEFSIVGYRNTAAEVYAQREGVEFISLGCKHNYFAEVVEPTDEENGYTVYTCTACGDTYTGDYIEPPEYYEGECGMGVSWRFFTKDKRLEISGSGYMNSYQAASEVPWNAFMNKIKSVVIGENITYISDYILCEAQNAESLIIHTKTASLSEKTVLLGDEGLLGIDLYAYDDSSASDYLSENSVPYISLGCAHSRGLEYYEEQPSCCFDTFGVYTCPDCSYSYREYISLDKKGHYFSGSLNTKNSNAICGAQVYVDGELCAITGAKGKYIVYPVLCGEHFVEIKSSNELIERFEITVDKSNLRCNSQCCFGDYDKNGYINAKDYSYALKKGYDNLSILDYGKAQDNSVTKNSYEYQELPYAIYVSNLPNDDSEIARDFVGIIENNSEYEIKESGFVYGKNMSDDMLYIENVGTVNSEGYAVKMKSASDNYVYQKVLKYSSSSGTGVLSARFYIIYTNGVKDFIYYSDVTSYTYPKQ